MVYPPPTSTCLGSGFIQLLSVATELFVAELSRLRLPDFNLFLLSACYAQWCQEVSKAEEPVAVDSRSGSPSAVFAGGIRMCEMA